MTIGVLWEFFEYFMDMVFHMNMLKDTIITEIHSIPIDQLGNLKSMVDIQTTVVNGELLNINGYLDIGLIDTLNDLIVNFIGAFVFSIFGYFYTKNHGEEWLAKQFVIIRKTKNADYLSQGLNKK